MSEELSNYWCDGYMILIHYRHNSDSCELCCMGLVGGTYKDKCDPNKPSTGELFRYKITSSTSRAQRFFVQDGDFDPEEIHLAREELIHWLNTNGSHMHTIADVSKLVKFWNNGLIGCDAVLVLTLPDEWMDQEWTEGTIDKEIEELYEQLVRP